MIPRWADTVLAAALILITCEVGLRGRGPSGPEESGVAARTPAPWADAARGTAVAPAAPAVPAAPTQVKALAGDRRVALSWRSGTGGVPVVSWRVQRAPAEDAEWRTLAQLPASRTSFLDQPLPNCVPWHYRIHGMAQDGTLSPASDPVSARPEGPPPAAPDRLSGLVVGTAWVRLTWHLDPDAPLASTEVYRADSADGPGQRVAIVAAPLATWMERIDPTGEAADVWPRFYYVRARERCGRLSPPSAPVRVVPRATH